MSSEQQTLWIQVIDADVTTWKAFASTLFGFILLFALVALALLGRWIRRGGLRRILR